jgi:DNA-binding transcriptional MocR family regulator
MRTHDRWNWACYVAAGHLNSVDRVVLLVIARHASRDGDGSFPSRDSIARSAGVTERTVSRSTRRLESLGLIHGEPRPGKTTIWRLTPDTGVLGDPGTPDPDVLGLRDDPGQTPDAPLPFVSYEGEGENDDGAAAVNELPGRSGAGTNFVVDLEAARLARRESA